MISLTESAINKVKKLIEIDPGRLGIRAAVQGGGCSGFKYLLDFVYHEDKNDKVFETDGIKLFVDPKSFLYLMGKRTCGCGESFSV